MSTSDVNRAGSRYAKALEAHARHERALRLAFGRWDRSRADLARLEKRLDRLTMGGDEMSPEDAARAYGPHDARARGAR